MSKIIFKKKGFNIVEGGHTPTPKASKILNTWWINVPTPYWLLHPFFQVDV
ncbi:MAG: hypothetical protein Q6366_003270 [Candidatus Freyarchaeota archaeon]